MSSPVVYARAIATAQGRVNLIGEHTDYHQGYVLPMPLQCRTQARLERRDDQRVVVTSDAGTDTNGQFVLGEERAGQGWLDYVQGVTTALRQRGYDVPGFNAGITSTVPVGAGVSSSAALCVSLLRALRQLAGLPFGDVALAQMAHAVETDFVGVPVGLMDPMACSLGKDGHALFLDTRLLSFQHILIPPSLEIITIDSGVTHRHAGGDYVGRRTESFDAAARLGVQWLRDADISESNRWSSLTPVLAKRARHVITENHRVLGAVQALKGGDGHALGELFSSSHASLRDEYNVSTPHVDSLVAICQACPGVYGARMTGGGFGGAVVMVAEAGTRGPRTGAIMAEYADRTGLHPAEIL